MYFWLTEACSFMPMSCMFSEQCNMVFNLSLCQAVGYMSVCLYMSYLPILHKTSQLSIVIRGRCAWVPRTIELETDKKKCKLCDKNWMFLSRLLCQCDVQSRFERLDGGTQDDISIQLGRSPDPGWNAEFKTMASGAVSVWNEVRWSRSIWRSNWPELQFNQKQSNFLKKHTWY